MVRIKMTNADEADDLMSAEEYDEYVEKESH
jgi:glycine cleavage system H lipoate-binding protein